LYAAYGGPAVALLDAVTFVLATVLYAGLRVRESRPQPPTAGWRAQTAEGARYLWAHGRLRPLVLAGGITMLCAGVNGAMVYAVVDGLGHSPSYAGVLAAVQGAGSVAVGLVSGSVLRRLGERRFAIWGIALMAAGVVFRAIPSDPVTLVCSVAIGVGLPCALIAAFTTVQRETPGPLLGRASATASTLIFAPNAVGLALGAGLVEPVGHRVVLVVLGLLLPLAALPLRHSLPRASHATAGSPSDANSAPR